MLQVIIRVHIMQVTGFHHRLEVGLIGIKLDATPFGCHQISFGHRQLDISGIEHRGPDSGKFLDQGLTAAPGRGRREFLGQPALPAGS